MKRLTEFWKEKNMYISDITLSEYTDDNGHFPISEEGVDKVVQKLGEYEDLEDRLNGISVKQVVQGFIKTVETQTCEGYEHGRILTNAEADKWNEYKQLEKQGLLLRLPCKVGDAIYVNGILGVGEEEEYKVIRVDYHSNLATKRSEFYIEALLVSDPENSIGFYDKEIGKTVFLTQAEAEKKLKETKDNYTR